MDKGDNENQLLNNEDNSDDEDGSIFYYILDGFMTWIDRATGLDIDRVCSAIEKGDLEAFKKQIKIFNKNINKKKKEMMGYHHYI